MCASSWARIASTCAGVSAATAATGRRITGRSHPTTVGTSTSVDSTTCAATTSRRSARRRHASCQRDGGVASAMRCRRRTRHQPPSMRPRSTKTPSSHASVIPRTKRSSGVASTVFAAKDCRRGGACSARARSVQPRFGRSRSAGVAAAVVLESAGGPDTGRRARSGRASSAPTLSASMRFGSVRAVAAGAAIIATRPAQAIR